jgi:hypothetical protein
MRSRSFRDVLWAAVLVSATAGLLLSFSAQAQQQSGQLTPQQFQANPGNVLANFQQGGPLLISLIRQLALADQADLPLIIGLLANANAEQATAIGTGLGQAALASVTTNQSYAFDIQRDVGAANNPTSALAFAAVLGDQQLAAAGPGVGGGGGGGESATGSSSGGGGGGGGGGTPGPTSSPLPNLARTSNSSNFFSSSSASGSPH